MSDQVVALELEAATEALQREKAQRALDRANSAAVSHNHQHHQHAQYHQPHSQQQQGPRRAGSAPRPHQSTNNNAAGASMGLKQAQATDEARLAHLQHVNRRQQQLPTNRPSSAILRNNSNDNMQRRLQDEVKASHPLSCHQQSPQRRRQQLRSVYDDDKDHNTSHPSSRTIRDESSLLAESKFANSGSFSSSIRKEAPPLSLKDLLRDD